MPFSTAINQSGTIAAVLNGWSNNIFGSPDIMLFFVIILLIAFAVSFRIPIEFTALLVLPLVLVVAAYTAELLILVYVFAIYAGIMVYKYWIVRL